MRNDHEGGTKLQHQAKRTGKKVEVSRVTSAVRPVGPLASLLRDLPKLREKAGHVDLAGSTSGLVHSIMENAETTVSSMNRALAAIGVLIAHSSVEIEDGTVHQETIEALGWALSEMGELAGACMVLAAQCRFAHPPPPVDMAPAWFQIAMEKARAANPPTCESMP